MTDRKNIFTLRIINAALFAFLIFLQYNGVFSIKIFTANPMLPLALLTAMCMFCSELTGAISGLLVGIFVDTATSTPQGFNSILFLLLGLACVLIVKFLFNNNIFSAISLCFLCVFTYLILRWIFCIAFFASFTENLTYVIRTIFPSCVYTAIFAIPFYYLERYLYQRFYKRF